MVKIQESEDALEKLRIEIKEEREIRRRTERENVEIKRRATEIEDNYEKLAQQSKSDQRIAD